ATWNVNSLQARLERVEHWLSSARPDVVCLQETKLADDAVPALAFQALGYDCVHHGEGRWNGVAILSRVGIDDVVSGFAEGIEPDTDARLVTATCAGVRVTSVYVPNGRSVDDDHYRYKLSWLARLREHLDATSSPDDDVVVLGDWNVAPTDDDVWSPEQVHGSTHITAPERDAVEALRDWGLVDVFRRHHPETGLYSWWDYRRGDFHQRKGLRIDFALASTSVVERTEFVVIDRNARKGKQPSDHAPVVLDLAA
ncbi:MAG: exodeoxyribonuclease III, partial [Actinomycetota bacterium]